MAMSKNAKVESLIYNKKTPDTLSTGSFLL